MNLQTNKEIKGTFLRRLSVVYCVLIMFVILFSNVFGFCPLYMVVEFVLCI